MKIIKSLLLLVAVNFFLVENITAQISDSIKIVKGKIDTVNSQSYVVVGVTKPNSQIFINGQQIKQFKTGSFGTEVNLNEGANVINIKAVDGKIERSKTISIFYKKIDMPISDTKPKDYKFPVVVTKEGAYLNYGAGQDRLGGAKINFLPKGVKMAMIDSVDNLYKVRLSENSYAFIPKDYVEIAEVGTRPPYSLTGSWTVSNSGQFDKVRVTLEDKQPFIAFQEIDPSRLVVDIYGAACNSNWITQYFGLKSIQYVDFKQINPDVFRVIIMLKDKYSWGYKIDYVGNSLEISVKSAPKLSLKGLVIGVDAGHGGPKSLGAVSPAGHQEKVQNLAMAYMLKEELEKKGAVVVLSRKDDSDVSMTERKAIFSKARIDLLISIHCNAGGNPLKTGGTSTYYKHIEYRDLAETILKRLLEMDVNNFGHVGNFNFSLNAPTDYPSVLVETLFMSNLYDEEKIIDPKFQRSMMKKVVKGLEDYLSKVKKSNK